MLNQLNDIQELLESARSESLRLAADLLEGLLPAAGTLAAADQAALGRIVLQVTTIQALSQSGINHFANRGALRPVAFSAYERRGALKTLESLPRTIGQL